MILPRRGDAVDPLPAFDRFGCFATLSDHLGRLYRNGWHHSIDDCDPAVRAGMRAALRLFGVAPLGLGGMQIGPDPSGPGEVCEDPALAAIAYALFACSDADSNETVLIDYWLSREGVAFVLQAMLGTFRFEFTRYYDV